MNFHATFLPGFAGYGQAMPSVARGGERLPREAVKFSGVTGNLSGRHWVSPDTLQKLLNLSPTPYVGRLSPAFIEAIPGNPKLVYQGLDEVVTLVRGITDFKDVRLEFNLGDSPTPFKLRFLGSGGAGAVYELSAGDKSFALKVYHHYEIDELPTAGPEEAAAGLYLQGKTLKDLARFEFGNPKGAWGVFEFIGDDVRLNERKGQSVTELPVTLADDIPKNRVKGVRVDYGGIREGKLSVVVKTFDDYKRAISSGVRAVQADAAAQIDQLPEDEGMEAFRLAMETGDQVVQARAAKQIKYLPIEFRHEAYQEAMGTREPAIQASAAGNICCLLEEDREKAYVEAMDSGDLAVQTVAAGNIYALPGHLRKDALLAAMETGIPEVQQAALTQIPFTPSGERESGFVEKMFQMGYGSEHPGVRKAAVAHYFALPEAAAMKVFQEIMASGSPEFQSLVVGGIPYFSADNVREAFLLGMASPYPEVLRLVAWRLYALPEDFMAEGFRLALANPDPRVKAIAASQLMYLPGDFQKEFFLSAFETREPMVIAGAVSQLLEIGGPLRKELFPVYKETMEHGLSLKFVKNLTIRHDAP